MKNISQAELKKYGIWVAAVVVPLMVNVLIWNVLTKPSIQKLHELKFLDKGVQAKPKLQLLIQGSHEVVDDWESRGLMFQDTTNALREIRRLSGDFNLHVKGVRTEGSPTPLSGSSGFKRVPILVDAAGQYDEIAQWLSAIESKPGLQIEHWSLSSGKSNQNVEDLDVRISAIV